MKLLGAVLAGGRSSRFGSDKAEAMWQGHRLLDHVAAAIGRESDALVIVGRADAAYVCVSDEPGPDLGPLGGLAGALTAARDKGFDAVLTCPVDVPVPPSDLRAMLAAAPALLAGQPTIGLWPATLLPDLLEFIGKDAKRSVRGFAQRVGASFVDAPEPIVNINRPEDLDRLR